MIRKFALVFGIIYVLAGVAGFLPGLSTHPGSAPPLALQVSYGYLLGLFPVNAVHNLAHIAIGAWGLVASRSLPGARLFARGLAVIYGALAVLGLIPATNTLFGLAPIFGHDIWLHALSALVAAWFGFVAEKDIGPGGGHRLAS